MLNCQNIKFSEKLSYSRMSFANEIFGEKIIKRILAFSLFLLGVNRQDISNFLDVPLNTVKSNLKALHSDGITAFEDRRQKKASFLPSKKKDATILLFTENENIVISIDPNIKIQIPIENKLQLKTVILTILNNELIKT